MWYTQDSFYFKEKYVALKNMVFIILSLLTNTTDNSYSIGQQKDETDKI